VVPPDSQRISRARCYLGCHSRGTVTFVYGALTRCGDPFAWSSTSAELSYSLFARQNKLNDPTTPDTQRLPAITRNGFSLFRFRSPLLTESRLLSLPVGNEMFHFPTFPPHTLCVQAWVTGHDSCRVSPFGNPRITARLAAPRGLSQPPTSFFGSWCQGIHRVPLITWPQRCSRPLCSSQAAGGPASWCTPAENRLAMRRAVLARAGQKTGSRPEVAACPRPQDPTACLGRPCSVLAFPLPCGCGTGTAHRRCGLLVDVPPIEHYPGLNIRA